MAQKHNKNIKFIKGNITSNVDKKGNNKTVYPENESPISSKVVITEELEYDIGNVDDTVKLKEMLNQELFNIAQKSKDLKNRAMEIKEILNAMN